MPAPLGSSDKEGVIAPAGAINAGNWTVSMLQSDIGISLANFECYRIVISGGPPGSTFQVYIGNKLYDSVYPGDSNSWDPNNPMKLQSGDSVYFYWNSSSANYPPMVVMYFQEPTQL